MTKPIIIEVIATNVAEALDAEKGGANRLELIDNYPAGGTTPSLKIIKAIKKSVKIPVQVMIRSRGGDFCYSPEEFNEMKNSVRQCREIGVAGIVFGALTRDNKIDIDFSREIIALAKGLSITFHAAFDDISNQFQALKILTTLGIDRVLTMALYNPDKIGAVKARQKVKKMVQIVRGHISIMPAISPAGIDNIRDIVQTIGLREFHFGRAVRMPHEYTGKIDIKRLKQIKNLVSLSRHILNVRG